MFNILVVEDDAALRKMMQSVLQRNGYRTLLAEDGEAALAVLEREQADLIITDIMMPNMDGYELTELLRQSNYNMPILMVTVKESYTDKHRGFSAGIDDYMVKPIDINEMILRVRALLRRVHADSEPQREVLEFGELTIDVSGHKVLVNGEEIDLTASEFKLLTTLSRYPGRVYSRMELVEKVLGYDFEGYERTIDSHVKNLRAKIGDNPRSPKWLHTVHGVGYRFEDPTKQ